MSPVGMPRLPDRLDPEIINKGLDTWIEKKGLETFLWLWNDVHIAPFEISRAAGFLSKYVIRASLARRIKGIDDATIDIFASYIH